MALSQILKKRVKSMKRCHARITSLPRDLLVEVVAIVASNSFTDLHNTKLCCKDLLNAVEDNHVFQRVSLDKFPLIPWWPSSSEELSFLKQCRENQNLESLYREGLQESFEKIRETNSTDNNKSFLRLLKVAAEKGHMEAKYVYGMILLGFHQDNEEMKKEGLEHMRLLRKLKCVVKTRNKVRELVECMHFKNDVLFVPKHEHLCPSKNTCKGWSLLKNQNYWVLVKDDDEDYDNSCDYCRLDDELKVFHKMFKIREV